MITSRKVSQVNVFAGSPWEVASVKSLLKAAYIEASMKDNGLNSILISVPCEYYTAAMPGTMGDRTRLFSLCMILLKRSNL